MSRTLPDESLDLTGVPCPANSARTILRLEGMSSGSLLEVILDNGEPVENVISSMEGEGHEVMGKERLDQTRWKVLIRRSRAGEDG